MSMIKLCDMEHRHYTELVNYIMDLETAYPNELLIKIKDGAVELMEKHFEDGKNNIQK